MRSKEELVEYIRDLCSKTKGADNKSLSLTKLEEEFGWSNGTIGKWKGAKKYPSHDKLEMVASRFGITVEELLYKPEDQPKKPAPETENGEENAIMKEILEKLKRMNLEEMKKAKQILDVMSPTEEG